MQVNSFPEREKFIPKCLNLVVLVNSGSGETKVESVLGFVLEDIKHQIQ